MSVTAECTVDAGPFLAWFATRAAALGSDKAVLADLGWSGESGERRIRRWRHEITEGVDRATVEDALDRAGVLWHDVYPDDQADVDLEPDAYCGRCHELVTPIGGACPWCDAPTSAAEGRRREKCTRCHRIVVPARDGTCWRCGAPTTAIPWEPCECGCGNLKRQYDPQGRPCRYVRGHAPRRETDNGGDVDAVPFREYLERELREMDLLMALARQHGIPRDTVVAVLNGQETVQRKVVQRALWINARGGKGLPARPGAPGFFDLYPADRRARTCPGCGNGKAPHAELCKQCRRRLGDHHPPSSRVRLSPAVRREALRLRQQGVPRAEVARRLIDRAPHRSLGSLEQAIRILERQEAAAA